MSTFYLVFFRTFLGMKEEEKTLKTLEYLRYKRNNMLVYVLGLIDSGKAYIGNK